jgi:hypothetical protein
MLLSLPNETLAKLGRLRTTTTIRMIEKGSAPPEQEHHKIFLA